MLSKIIFMNCHVVSWADNKPYEVIQYYGFKSYEDYLHALHSVTNKIVVEVRSNIDSLDIIPVEKFRDLLFAKKNASTTVVQKELRQLCFDFHKIMDPTLGTYVYYMNRWHLASIVLHGNTVAVVDCPHLPTADRLSILRDLYFMFAAIMFIAQIRKSVTYLNKSQIEAARSMLPKSNALHPENYATISALFESIMERRAQLTLASVSDPKKLHNVWTGYIRTRTIAYANRLKDALIFITKEKKLQKTEVIEKDYADYYMDTLTAFKLEPEPIDDLIEYALKILEHKISKETAVYYIKKTQQLSIQELKMLVNKIISICGFPLDGSNINQINKLYSTTIHIPRIREEVVSKYSLQTYSNISKVVIVYLFLYLSKTRIHKTDADQEWI